MKRSYNIIGIISDYLDLKQIGLLEVVFASTILLSGFSLGSFPMSLLIWVVLFAILFFQGKISRIKTFGPLTLFIVYWVFHELAIMVIDEVNFNGFISNLIYFIAVFALYPVLNLKKLRGALNWIAIIAIMGLLYQWTDVMRGGLVHPLELPGLTMDESRLTTESLRPSSFFMEPASFVAYMICPLLFALIDKKYIWAIIIILSIFLTTSTTGMIVSFLMLGVSIFSSTKMRLLSFLSVGVIGVGLFFVLTNYSAFEYGVDKLQNTDTETNVRLAQGPSIVSTMRPGEYVFGAPYGTPYRYCISGRAPGVDYYGKAVFMSTFWLLILQYGIVGLFLYMNIYYQILRRNKKTIPLVVALLAVMFSSGYSTGIVFIFTLIILLVIVYNDNQYLTKV